MIIKFSSCNFASIIILGTFISCLQQKHSTVKEIISLELRNWFQPDWQSPDWDNSGSITISGEKANSENLMSVFSQWDKDSLYFYLKVKDVDLRAYQKEKDHPQLFLDDMVEVLIDAHNDKNNCWSDDDIVYHINLFGEKKDDRGTKECNSDSKWDGHGGISVQLFGTLNDTIDSDEGYIVTLSLPWSDLDLNPRIGLSLGINFANGDNDGKGRQLFDWVGVFPLRSPYAFGNLILN